ncbi:MAG: hypothetical protein UZ05_CHB002001404 [Chlorobi bacterium OLB5]|nr:MAG: hypothetical protein UZ05_CHB002001404 [Chlorobi bacterium OLB5]
MKYFQKILNSVIAVLFFFITQAACILYTQTDCDEKKIAESEETRRTAENNLIDARSITVNLPSGTELMAFYQGGDLLKISTTDNLSHSEQIFFSKGHLKVYEKSGYNNGKQYFNAWYADDGKIFCSRDMLSGRFLLLDENECIGILKTVDEYLLAIQ